MKEKLIQFVQTYYRHLLLLLLLVVLVFFVFFRGTDPERVVLDNEVELLEWMDVWLLWEKWDVIEGTWNAWFLEEEVEVDVVRRRVDPWSQVYRSVGKKWEEGHYGSIEVSGMLYSQESAQDNFVLLSWRSHVTFIMESFDVENIGNDGIRKLFLDHLRGKEFLNVNDYPFAQFVVDSSTFEEGEKVTLHGRLKIRDVIDTLSMEWVSFTQQWDTLYMKWMIELSRYVRWLDAMPWVIDEFIVIDFDIWLSRK